jgi:putative membrane protein
MSNETGERPPDSEAPQPAIALAQDLVGIPARLFRLVRKFGVGELLAHRLVDGIMASLGLGAARANPVEAPTDTGTVLALERTYLGTQRTLMAWVRTALSMISFGFTIGKLGEAIGDIEVRGLRGMKMVGTGTIAYLLVILGTAALLAAALQYSLRVQDLCSQGLRRQPSIEFVVAVLLVVLGLGAFSALVLKL